MASVQVKMMKSMYIQVVKLYTEYVSLLIVRALAGGRVPVRGDPANIGPAPTLVYRLCSGVGNFNVI